MQTPEPRHFSILVVDDNKENLKVVSNFLKTEGYQIALAISAEDARKILTTNSIDLILLDVMMPGIDGFTFCRQLKNDPDFLEIPVIFLTAKTETSDLVEGFKAGGVDYITKPFQREELIARVNNHIALAHAKRQVREQAEEIRKINLTKDRLYSVIAHDIKSPFSNISMLISSLAEGYLEAGTEEYDEILQSINSSTQETYRLLENLLQWTRSQTGDLHQSPEPLNLGEIIESTCRLLHPQANKKQVNLECHGDKTLIIKADRNMMQSILHNLISNAIKFTKEGGRVSVSTHREESQAVIRVKDNGVGIPKENLQKLFQDKGQLTTRGTSDEKGSGLGLLLVKNFVQKNNGSIEAESVVDEGSTFTVKFPLD
ncbi:MAG: response regulator [Bacteroidales bacterium]